MGKQENLKQDLERVMEEVALELGIVAGHACNGAVIFM